MKYGIITSCGSPQQYVELAVEAERAGWDGVFVWDGIDVGPREIYDPWVVLGAIAAMTSRITIGAMVFSLARRRPWKVARETITLDHLSNGRLVVPVGLGGAWDGGFARVNTDHPERKIRAALVDECLQILQLAWKGEPFSWQGEWYEATDLQFLPTPIRQPSIPIWPVGGWPHEKSLARAARYDGLVLYDMSGATGEGELTSAAVVRDAVAWMHEHRSSTAAYDIILEGVTTGTDLDADGARLQPLIDAGATWFIESRWGDDETYESLLERTRLGPPPFH